MQVNINKLASLGVAIGFLAATGAAKAQSVSQMFSFPTTSASFSLTHPFNLFDSSLGTLTSITIELATTGTANVTVGNSDSNPHNFTNAFVTLPLTVSGPPGSTTLLSENLTANIASGVANPGNNTFPGVPATNDITNSIPSADFSSYETPPNGGTFIITVASASATSGGTEVGGSGDLGFGGNGNASGTVTLVYNYQGPVGTPEPGTWALLFASGSISVLELRRRRARKS